MLSLSACSALLRGGAPVGVSGIDAASMAGLASATLDARATGGGPFLGAPPAPGAWRARRGGGFLGAARGCRGSGRDQEAPCALRTLSNTSLPLLTRSAP